MESFDFNPPHYWLIWITEAPGTSRKSFSLRFFLQIFGILLFLVNDPGSNVNPEDNNSGPDKAAKQKPKKKTKKRVIGAPESLIGEADEIFTDPPLIAELNARGGDILGVDNMFQLFVPIKDETSEYNIRYKGVKVLMRAKLIITFQLQWNGKIFWPCTSKSSEEVESRSS